MADNNHIFELRAYTRIAARLGEATEDILFVSDVVAELDAARLAGYATCLSGPETGRSRILKATSSFELLII